MASEAHVEVLKLQASVCAAMGSPFSARLLERAAGAVEAGDAATRALFTPWAAASRETLLADAVALRWLGAVHDLALSGEDEALSRAWPAPNRPGNEDAAWDAAQGAMVAQAPRFVAFMGHEPQTNEVRRSAGLLGGFLEAAHATGLPLRTFELGASAGLNQLWDRYRYALGPEAAWGEATSPVVLDTDWRGPLPRLEAPIEVVARAACDRAPVDLTQAGARRRLRAYVWADQFDRLQRLDAAVAVALEAGARVEAIDALAFTRERVRPQAGALSVIYHSVFWQYLPAATRDDLQAAIADLGASATGRAPLAWLRMEPRPPDMATMEIRLTLWPGGEDRRLARGHPHGAWVDWEAAGG
jgi:hypothetical protein